MPSLKEFNVKIQSLANTAKVTKTMNMVSSAKFRKAQDAQDNSRLYSDQLTDVISRLAAASTDSKHPLMEQREASKVLVIALASDRGLCAGFNNNLIKFTEAWLKDNKEKYETIDFIACGKRVINSLSKNQNIIKSIEDTSGSPTFEIAKEIGELAQEQFTNGTYDEVILLYNLFESALSQKPQIEKLLPVSPVANEEEDSNDVSDYIYEPGQQELLSYLLPKTVNFRVFSAFLENAAGEHAARMAAMDSATTNANKMKEEYTILRNRARQAAITTELTEIVAGAESLK